MEGMVIVTEHMQVLQVAEVEVVVEPMLIQRCLQLEVKEEMAADMELEEEGAVPVVHLTAKQAQGDKVHLVCVW
jgi:flagellar assembly factor FliW